METLLLRTFRGSRRLQPLLLCVLASLGVTACKDKAAPTGPTPITSRASLLPSSNGVLQDNIQSQISGFNQVRVFDDFTFTAASTIRTVAWQGAYCVPVTNAPAPTPNATGFRISFYADSGGRPQLAAPLAQVNYTLAQVGETLDRTITGIPCTDGATRNGTNVTYGAYRYQATLPTPFVAAANTKYWLVAQAITPSFDTLWGWRDGLADNGVALVYSGNSLVRTSTFDRAFSLTP